MSFFVFSAFYVQKIMYIKKHRYIECAYAMFDFHYVILCQSMSHYVHFGECT